MKNKFGLLLCAVTVLGAFSCDRRDEKKPDNGNGGNGGNDNPPVQQYDVEAAKANYLKDANEVVINEDSVTFTDNSEDAQPKTIKKNPSKVLNLYASFTTLWYEAGGTCTGVIGGKSSSSQYVDYIGRDITQDEGINVVATSSAGKNWKTENMIALQPDLIICSSAMNGYKTIKTPAKNANIPLIVPNYDDFGDYLKWFKVFSAITGHEDLWESVALKALDEVVTVLKEVDPLTGPKVLEIFGGTSASQVNTKNTVLGEMAIELKATNVADSWGGASDAERIDINLEQTKLDEPDMILVQCHAGEEEIKDMIKTTFGENPIWNSLKAVKENKVFYFEKLYYHNKPNSKFAYAYKHLAEVLYPDQAFSWEK